jgi:hypothetical protein
LEFFIIFSFFRQLALRQKLLITFVKVFPIIPFNKIQFFPILV